MTTFSTLVLANIIATLFRKFYRSRLFLFVIGHLLTITWFNLYTDLNILDTVIISVLLNVFAYFVSERDKFVFSLVLISYMLMLYKIVMVFYPFVGGLL